MKHIQNTNITRKSIIGKIAVTVPGLIIKSDLTPKPYRKALKPSEYPRLDEIFHICGDFENIQRNDHKRMLVIIDSKGNEWIVDARKMAVIDSENDASPIDKAWGKPEKLNISIKPHFVKATEYWGGCLNKVVRLRTDAPAAAQHAFSEKGLNPNGEYHVRNVTQNSKEDRDPWDLGLDSWKAGNENFTEGEAIVELYNHGESVWVAKSDLEVKATTPPPSISP